MKNIFFALVVLFCGFSHAEDKPEVKPHMQQLYVLISKLQPYVLNKAEYMNEKNTKEISEALEQFKEKTEKLKKDKMAQSDDMKFRAKQLSEDLNEAESSFKNGFKDYSYWVLKSSFNNCFSCHTQKSLSQTELKFSKDNKADDYSNAEFLFIVRNYAEAMPIFEKIVSGYPGNKSSVENLENSLQKILFYSVRVLRDDQATLKVFDKLLKNNGLPETVRNDLLAWKNYLTVKKYRIVESAEVKDKKSLEKFVEERSAIADHYKLARQRHIVDLETSYFLFQLLEKSTDVKLKPWILYYSAEIEKDYRSSMFDLTVERYLKECIEVYSKSDAAKKCLVLFKEIKKDAYTGSRGTDLPKSVIELFNKYDKLVNPK